MNNSVTNEVLKRCRAFADEHAMFCGCSHILVGFSGGADSCCLLSALNSIKTDYDFTITAVHINHGIRGPEAGRDEEFCRSFCEKSGIDFKLFEVNVPAVSTDTGESCEECARRLRYESFNSLCFDDKTRIATAHNANDNAETVIFNISRGSSLKGACGIPAVRDNIIRPLLTCTRDMTEDYCRENGIEYVVDSTNLTDDYSRNKIRHNVLPVLESLNNAAVLNIMHFSHSVCEDNNYLETLAENIYTEIFNNYCCSADSLVKLHISLRNRVVSSAVFDFCGKICDFCKLEAINRLIENGGRIQLFGNIYAENVGGIFRIFDNIPHNDRCVEKAVELNSFPLVFGDYRINAESYTNCSKFISNNVLDNLVDCDKIIGSLSVRVRSAGDKFTLGRRNVTKSVKKLFNELNIPVEERDSLPMLCDASGIVWIAGIGTARRCLPDKKSTNIYLIGGEKYDK